TDSTNLISNNIQIFYNFIKIFLFISFTFCRHEQGFFYSLAERKFLTNSRNKDDLIELTTSMPTPFAIIDNKNNTVTIKVTHIENENPDGSKVFDSSRSNYDLISYDYHGSDNQQFQLSYVGNDTIKLITNGRCITTEKGFKYLTETDCSDSPGQLFRWVTKKDENKIREYLRRCDQANNKNSNYYGNYDDYGNPDNRRRRPYDKNSYDRGPRDSYDRGPFDRPRDTYDRGPFDRPRDSYDRGPRYDRGEYRNSPRDPFNDRDRDRLLSNCLGLNENELRDKLYDLKAIANDT
ncbi:putative Ricin B-related lectin protein, partial [Pseudoloma neurophilia]